MRSGLLDRVKKSLESEGISYKELGADPADIPELTQKVLTRGGKVVKSLYGFTELSAEDIKKIYELMR